MRPASSPLHIFLGTGFLWWWVWSQRRKHLRPETHQIVYGDGTRLHKCASRSKTQRCCSAHLLVAWFDFRDGFRHTHIKDVLITHLRGEDVVSHIHHTVVMVTKAFDFCHHSGLDAGVGHLISFFVDENPAAGQRHNATHLPAGCAF